MVAIIAIEKMCLILYNHVANVANVASPWRVCAHCRRFHTWRSPVDDIFARHAGRYLPPIPPTSVIVVQPDRGSASNTVLHGNLHTAYHVYRKNVMFGNQLGKFLPSAVQRHKQPPCSGARPVDAKRTRHHYSTTNRPGSVPFTVC